MASSTSMNRCDHHVWAIGPRALRAFRPLSTGRGRDGGGYPRGYGGVPRLALLTDRPFRQAEQLAQIAGGQFGQPTFPVADDEIGQRLLLLDHVVDLLLERAGAD